MGSRSRLMSCRGSGAGPCEVRREQAARERFEWSRRWPTASGRRIRRRATANGPVVQPIRLGHDDLLEVRFEDRGNIATLGLAGDLDLSVAPQLQQLVHDIVVHISLPLVLDLSEVRFCDLAGVRALAALRENARGRVVFCAVPPQVRRLVELVGFSSILPLTHSALAETAEL